MTTAAYTTDDVQAVLDKTTRFDNTRLQSSRIETPLGPMLAIADNTHLLLLEFIKCKGLTREIEQLKQQLQSAIVPGRTPPLLRIEKELKQYFSGNLVQFRTPIKLMGTDFQKTVWRALIDIPAGHTASYADIARAINRSTAFRAVARANGCNQLAIIVPCHRVINSDGKLGGYGGGVDKKAWLLEHERL